MNIRYAKEQDLNQIKDIWKYCFNDTEDFMGYYFNNKYKEENTIVLEENSIVSSLQMNKYTLNINGANYKVSYVVGVSTLPQVRGKGYMKYIMEYMFNELYNNNELIINRTSNLMQMIRRIQDEVHRFAITYHRSLRDKRTLHSILDDIPFIGERRRRALLMKFGSVDNIRKSSIEELLETPSIDKKAAESVYNYFNGKN